MNQSETITMLIGALTKAQSEFKVVPKTKRGQEGHRFFQYADLADVVSMVTPILNKQGIFLSQPIILDLNGNTRQSTRLQLGEEYIQTDGIKLADDVPGKNLGISVTYARRIDLNGLLGIAPDEDVDAPDLNVAQSSIQKTVPAKAITQVGGATLGKAEVKKAPLYTSGTGVSSKLEKELHITNEDFPDNFIKGESKDKEQPLAPEDAKIADELGKFVPLTQERNTEIQNYLKDLVTGKTLDRRKLSLFLDREHEGKKSFDVSADKWEGTVSKIETAVANGQDGIKAMLKGE